MLLFRTAIIRRFTGNRHIVRMTFHYTGICDTGKFGIVKFFNIGSTTISHTCTQTTSVFAQEDPVLMRVNGKDILRSEFEYSYRHRTGNADAKLSPKEYAELFAQSKLKVEAAKVAGLDTTTMFRKLQEDQTLTP